MAYKSDRIVKEELLSIGNMGDLKLRIFPGDSRDDQIHWVDGGLCFGKRELLYGSCDGAWYVEESWIDPLTGEPISVLSSELREHLHWSGVAVAMRNINDSFTHLVPSFPG